ncbi:hypothetical protein TanjilG_12943 [Lupinus angustifolius]|uniref:Uncharacterized protein n=1 Tax=Lupinus angustifolius TaxID=3871 RepID=A0A1J7HP10_LUPAN|nr:hypothetical protein TanjilG_12943 [Lupinus angustifolius]
MKVDSTWSLSQFTSIIDKWSGYKLWDRKCSSHKTEPIFASSFKPITKKYLTLVYRNAPKRIALKK